VIIKLALLLSTAAMAAAESRPWPDRKWSDLTPGSYPNSVVLYYKPDDEASTKLIEEMEKATERLAGFAFVQGMRDGYKKHLKLAKVDVVKYSDEKKKAGLKDDEVPGIFTTISGSYERGSKEKFGSLTADNLVDYIYAEAIEDVPSKVVPFASEDALWDSITAEAPALVCFCVDNSGCDRISRPFKRSSSFHGDGVVHIDVNCNGSEAEKQFCRDQEIGQHPTVNLYTEDGEVQTYNGMKTLRALQEFVGMHCSGCKKPAEGMGSN